MKLFSVVLLILPLSACTTSQLNGAIEKAWGTKDSPLTSDEVARGLKEALEKGADYAVKNGSSKNSFLNNVKIKIPFPPELQDVQTKINSIGLSNLTESFVAKLNQAAELAAAEAKPIFFSKHSQHDFK